MPKDYRVLVELRPGYFLGPNQNRCEDRIKYLQGTPLDDMTILMINATAEAVNAPPPFMTPRPMKLAPVLSGSG